MCLRPLQPGVVSRPLMQNFWVSYPNILVECFSRKKFLLIMEFAVIKRAVSCLQGWRATIVHFLKGGRAFMIIGRC